MKFEEKNSLIKFGEVSGYLISYFIFTTILFFMLTIFSKLPEGWNYLHIMATTFIIALLGTLIKYLLK